MGVSQGPLTKVLDPLGSDSCAGGASPAPSCPGSAGTKTSPRCSCIPAPHAVLGRMTQSLISPQADPISQADPLSQADPISEVDPISEADPISEVEPVSEAVPISAPQDGMQGPQQPEPWE